MIRVKVFERSIEIEGHSLFDVEGRDIVCAAVSSMAQLAGYQIERLGGRMLKKKGYVRIDWKEDGCSEVVIETLLDALKSLERDYPENIRVEVV